jgi:2-polyprenyl-6-hydroxyphenyl methylase/3-demethylubiquinone-9 3-methyltransferase
MTKSNIDTERAYYFKTIADQFEHLDNPYDVKRRKEIVFEEFLSGHELENSQVLDAGCGYGAFSSKFAQKGCQLISVDIVLELVKKTVDKTDLYGCDADASMLPFANETFDFVISSEMVEHTPNPTKTVLELLRVTKSNGYLIITTPNKKWQFIVRTASTLHLRNFHGIENFLGFRQLGHIFDLPDVETLKHVGFYLIPFQFKFFWIISRSLDKKWGHKLLGQFMINQAIFVRKNGKTQS